MANAEMSDNTEAFEQNIKQAYGEGNLLPRWACLGRAAS